MVTYMQYDLCHIALPAQLAEDIEQVDKETDVLKQCEVLSYLLYSRKYWWSQYLAYCICHKRLLWAFKLGCCCMLCVQEKHREELEALGQQQEELSEKAVRHCTFVQWCCTAANLFLTVPVSLHVCTYSTLHHSIVQYTAQLHCV